jgi:iron(III) transport system ATP-binding protein
MTDTEAVLRVEDLAKRYAGSDNSARAVDGVSFTIEEGKFYTLLGPSGCGKTTTLRCVAGLEKTDAGRITLAGKIVSNHKPDIFVRPDERDIGMVFQSYAIWPHMSVFENVAFPLRAAGRKRRRVPRNGIKARVMEVLETVQLSGYENRMATKLSGGQQQRLALARALAQEPQLILLDEPLSNLDASLRELMRSELRRLQRQVGVTTLYVTHDQSEALSMSSRIAVMEQGHIVQEGKPREVYRLPKTKFVASFVGRTNLLDAKILGKADGESFSLETGAGVVGAICPAGIARHDEVSLSIRPEDIRLHSAQPPEGLPNVIAGRVASVHFLGEFIEYHLSVGKELLISRQHPDVQFRRGAELFVELPVKRCVVVSDEFGTTGNFDDTDQDDSEDESVPWQDESAAIVALAGQKTQP